VSGRPTRTTRCGPSCRPTPASGCTAASSARPSASGSSCAARASRFLGRWTSWSPARLAQGIARWGFFNQELYGPPTNLPWGIAIDCAHRIGDHGLAQYACEQFPEATTGFHPLFLYESISGVLGAVFLIWLSRRRPYPLRTGDQALIFFIWYPIVRFLLETFDGTVVGIPTAQTCRSHRPRRLLILLTGIDAGTTPHRGRTDDFDEPGERGEPDAPNEPGAAAAIDADEDRMTDDGGAETRRTREGD
jgi:hypothetical protein